MSTVSPHAAFEVITCDQVAECWDGVYKNEAVPDLYEQLWACVPEKASFDREDCGPADVVGVDCVADAWAKFTPEAQVELNRLAAAQEIEWFDDESPAPGVRYRNYPGQGEY
jgi:hypothetical protein